MEKVNSGEELLKAMKENKDFILEHNLYELYFESTWRTLMTDEIRNYAKTHTVLKGEKR